MTKTALITLGRLPKAYEIARAMSLAGWRVVIAEPWAWHLCRVSRHVSKSIKVHSPVTNLAKFHDDLLTVIRQERVSLVIPVSEEVFHVASLIPRLPDGVRWFGSGAEELLPLHDKLDFQRQVSAAQLVGPRTFAADSPEAAEFAAQRSVVMKPRCGSAGNGVTIFNEGLPPGVTKASQIIQAYLPGEEFSTFSVAWKGRVIGTIQYRGRILSGTVAVNFERLEQPDPAVDQWINAFVAFRGHSGFISFDFRRDESGVALPMECNPRATSGIHFVDSSNLAMAITDPEQATQLNHHSERCLQQFYPALTETQGSVFRGGAWRKNLKLLFSCRDVTWHRDDPWTFPLLPFSSWEILRRTIFRKQSFGEATTEDIGFYTNPSH